MELKINEKAESESIKLERGMKGHYGWEIKIFPGKMNDAAMLARLKAIDAELTKQYGGLENA